MSISRLSTFPVGETGDVTLRVVLSQDTALLYWVTTIIPFNEHKRRYRDLKICVNTHVSFVRLVIRTTQVSKVLTVQPHHQQQCATDAPIKYVSSAENLRGHIYLWLMYTRYICIYNIYIHFVKIVVVLGGNLFSSLGENTYIYIYSLRLNLCFFCERADKEKQIKTQFILVQIYMCLLKSGEENNFWPESKPVTSCSPFWMPRWW